MAAVADFNDTAVDEIFSRVVSFAMETGRFDYVNQHEPTSAPHNGLQCSFWIQRIRPIQQSGIGVISGVLELNCRIYMSFRQQPHDLIDPLITSAVNALIGAFSGDFDFGGVPDVRAVDLLGISGTSLSAQAGYIEIDKKMYRVMTLTLPIIVNDMWSLNG